MRGSWPQPTQRPAASSSATGRTVPIRRSSSAHSTASMSAATSTLPDSPTSTSRDCASAYSSRRSCPPPRPEARLAELADRLAYAHERPLELRQTRLVRAPELALDAPLAQTQEELLAGLRVDPGSGRACVQLGEQRHDLVVGRALDELRADAP